MQESQSELFQPDDDLLTLLDNIDTLDTDPRLWPKTLHDLMSVMEAQIKTRHPKLSDNAYEIARTNVIAVAHYLGGRQLYLPRDDRLQKAFRDYKIYHHQFTGNNHKELALEYGLTSVQIYNIVASQHKLHTARIQPSLFN
ncbi:hypothetical protein TW85_24920 [Marinomonas sp. S3726]|uniref:Mor transcription activator family protein n=1 Tax=Marinomonas sp. S3726 TaxID=579484 RepID=UPI0005F9F261|nr:Mor transcription activator family protein [Marinomonas sp. S3726]KJZ07034.1 hypothetical protein TW85_24920 [Marinomonas sp. S3726]